MLYQSVSDIYKDFLKEIKKNNIASVTPSQFIIIINDAYSSWVKSKLPDVEIDQKKIDDLKELIVITDGYFEAEGNVLASIKVLDETTIGSSNIFPYPRGIDNSPVQEIDGVTYPSYRRMLKIEFKYKYYNDPCYPDGISPWIGATYLKSNQFDEIRKNPFREPSYSKIYYTFRGSNIELWLGDTTENFGVEMRLEYVKYPRLIHFDATTPANNVMPEVQSDQIKEIIEIASRTYIAELSDPRYQLELQEMQLNQRGK